MVNTYNQNIWIPYQSFLITECEIALLCMIASYLFIGYFEVHTSIPESRVHKLPVLQTSGLKNYKPRIVTV